MSINQAPVLTTGDANGVVKLDFGSYNANAPHVAVQADGKIVVTGYVVASAGSDVRSELIRYNADGSPDTTFGTDGIVSSALFAATRRADVAIQADGKIVVTDSDYTVTRYNSDGSLDTSFGNGGTAATVLDYSASSVLIQADGKIVVSGSDFALARYDSNGNLDPSFGVGGKVNTGFGQGFGLVGQPDGKLIVAGEVSAGGHTSFAVARYNADGSLDASFGAGGEVSTSFGSTNDSGYSVTLQADGKIVVAGASDFSKNLAVARYNVDGSLDASFGSGGMLTTSVPSGFGEAAKSVKIQPDGKIVVAGYSFIGGNNTDFVLVRYNSDGSLDSSFGTGGKVATELGSRADAANSIVLLPDGKILVVGTTGDGPFGTAPDQPGQDFALARYNSDGSLDTSFGAATALNGPAFFIEDTIPTVLNARATVHDAELDAANSYAGASLTLARHGGANAEDVFGASGNLAMLAQGGDIMLSGTAIGTVTQNAGGTLVLSFGAAATEARVNEAMRDITYTNSSENPTGAARIDWSFSDGNAGAQGSGGALAATGFSTVNLSPVNDEPVHTVPGTLSTLADVDLAITGLSVSDPDSASLTSVVSVSHGTLTATGVSGSGTKELFLQGSVAQINAALSHVVYHSAAAFSGADKLTITTIDQAGTPSAIVSNDVTLNVTAVPGSVSINDVTISEGDSGAKVATFTVTRSDGTAPIDVDFATADGSATTADNDYAATSGTLHFAAGVKTQTISVTVNGDGNVEADEAFSVNLSGATNGATISDSSATGTISNDDAVPAGSVSINDVTISEGDSGSKVATFTVTRSGGTAAFDVDFATSDGSATTADSDYAGTSGTLHFADGVNTQTISVTVNGDSKFESDETFSVNLSGATNGAAIGHSSGTGTISNDDPEPAGSVSINDVTISEGDSGAKVAIFTVTRSGGTAAFDVDFATADGSATTADNDYVANAGTLHFGAGVDTQTISVAVNGDTKVESDEAFSVNLSGATNGASVNHGLGSGTIMNDDASSVFPDLTVSNVVLNPVAIIYTINNSAAGTAAASTAGIYLSTDSAITTSDTLIGTHATPALAAGGSDLEIAELSFPADLTPGNYFVGAIADQNGQIAESNETNNASGGIAIVLGNDGANAVNGAAGNDTILGLGGNDLLDGGPGNDTIDGGGGLDTATFAGLHSAYSITHLGSGLLQVSGPDGVDTLTNVERLAFDDVTVPLASIRTDFDGNGHSDILWQRDDATVAVWDNGQIGGGHWISDPGLVPASWHIAGKGDFDGNGHSDVLWRNDNGSVSIWDNGEIGGAHIVSGPGVVPNSWHISGTGDFDGNGHDDILWRNDNGAASIWDNGDINHAHIIAGAGIIPSGWNIAGTGDFDGNGQSDILWRNDDGRASIWDNGDINQAHIIAGAGIIPSGWSIAGTGDFDGNGRSDILWHRGDGSVSIWDNGAIGGAHIIANPGVVPSGWHIAGTGDFDGNGHSDILWRNDNGAASIWDNGDITHAHIIADAGVVPDGWHIV